MPAAPVSIAGPTEKSMRFDRCDGLWSIRESQREIQLMESGGGVADLHAVRCCC